MNKEKYKSNITGKVVLMTVVSVLVLTIVFLLSYFNYKSEYEKIKRENSNGNTIVALNEIKQQLNASENVDSTVNKISGVKNKLDDIIENLQKKEMVVFEHNTSFLFNSYIVSLILVLFIFSFIYMLILRPFHKLEKFAAEIATGNLDKELKYERINMFGEFTWAFDHMRREIKKARQCEHEAVENNKTVIATLSHDIKTPISSIRAYSEALSESMDSTPERRKRYIDVIIKKCDEVTRITDDMFIHSLHDLDKLVIKKETVKLHQVIEETLNAMTGSKSDIIFGKIKECELLSGDSLRIAQVIENVINNARKYAAGNIYVNTEILDISGKGTSIDKGNEYLISIRDCGPGIPAENMPFIFNKFYRGNNAGNETGAGLGLFIVKYIMEQMDGRVELINSEDGLEVKLYFVLRIP